MMRSILPPHLIEHLATTSSSFRNSLALDVGIRTVRRVAPAGTTPKVDVFDAKNSMNLPGQEVEGKGPAEAQRVRSHADAVKQLDGTLPKTDMPDLVVNYGTVYPNAFFDGEYLVFGEGDGEIFGDFTKPVEVFAHEYGHKIIEGGPKLEYTGQPGALNEHIADVIGVCVKLHQDKGKGDWRIGAGLFLKPGPALRDMAKPGTAYDNDLLGKDPQVGHMDKFVDTFLDNGGVHINSGIPNKAFTVFAGKSGQHPWQAPLKVWLKAMAKAKPTTTFAEFAALTHNAAADQPQPVRTAVVEGWKAVGITVGT